MEKSKGLCPKRSFAMRQNICKNSECRLWDSDFPNNCKIMSEIKCCRVLKGQLLEKKALLNRKKSPRKEAK
jgi:hypothetical protein